MRRLHDALVAREYQVWVDWEDIPPSAEWFEEIRAGVRDADGFVFVISPDSVASEVCTRELEHAFDQNKRVVPVVCRDPGGVNVPERAAALNWVFLRDSDDFDAGFQALVTALETDLDHVRVHTRLGVQADRWESSGRDASQLLRGSDLAAAEAWLVAGAGKQPEATQLQREYLLAGRQGATRRQRTIIGAVTVALAVAVVLAIVALVQRSTAIHERNVAYARQLDADAQANFTTDPELSVLLAARAARVEASSESETTLRQALAASNVRARYELPSPGYAGDVLPSPDGRLLLLTGPASQSAAWARVYVPGSRRPLFSVPGPATSGVSGWSANGRRFVIGGGAAAAYDARSGHVVFRVPTIALNAALTGDGGRLVTTDLHSVGHVYEIATARQVATFRPRYRGGVTCFALSPDGRYVAQCDALTLSGTTSTPSEVDVWSTRDGRLVRRVTSAQLIGSVAFSADSRRFVFTTSSRAPAGRRARAAAFAFEAAPGTLVYDVTGGGGPVITFQGAASAASFSPSFGPSPSDESLAYATISDDIVHLYDFYSGRNYPLPGATASIDALAWDDSGRYLAAAGDDGVIRIYDHTQPGGAIESLIGHSGRVRSLGFVLGAEYVASSADDGTSRVWQGPAPIPVAQRSDSPAGDGGVLSASFDPGGRELVLDGSGSRFANQGRILDTGTLRTAATFSAPAGEVLIGSVVSPAAPVIGSLLAGPSSRTGKLAYASVDTYNARTGARLATLRPSGDRALLNGVLNDDGSEAVTLESGGQAELWDVRGGRLLHVLAGASSPIASATFSRGGRLLAITHYPTLAGTLPGLTTGRPVIVQLWETSTGRPLRTITAENLDPQIPGTKVFAPLVAAFSPDGRTVAVSGAQSNVELFSVTTGAKLRTLSIAGLAAGSYAATLAFSPDGRYLAAGAISGAYVWRVPSYELLGVFQQVPSGAPLLTEGTSVRVSFTADSRELVMFGWNMLEVWNVASHLKLFSTGPAAIASGSVSADGSRIVTTSATRGVALYSCSLCGGVPQLLQVAAHRVTRALTPAERNRYLTGG